MLFLIQVRPTHIDQDRGFLFVIIKRRKELQGFLEVTHGAGKFAPVFVVTAQIIEGNSLLPWIACQLRLTELFAELLES